MLTGSVRGGTGVDILDVSLGGATLNLNVAGNQVQDIEIVRLTGGSANVLTLSVADVLTISSETDTLRIEGDGADTVDMGAGWTAGDDQVIGPNTYHSYTQGLATLLVDSDIVQS